MAGLERRLIDESRALISGVGLMERTHHRSTTVEERVDASVQVTLSDDEMSATATFYPPRGSGRPLSIEAVYEALGEAAITHGIDEESIGSAVYTCNSERAALHSIAVACGTAPVKAVPERLELVPREPQDPAEVAGRLDHRARSTLPLVKAGDVVARVITATPGSAGKTVTGRELPFRTSRPAGVQPGEHTVLRGRALHATVDGLVHMDDRTIIVSPTLIVEGNVDYHTGNIEFKGDVVVQGRVSDGFAIECGGMLYAASTLDSYGISCGNLIASQGLIGHTEDVIRVGESVAARFIQNARIEAGATVSVSASILSSHLTSTETIELGPGSTVVGSTLRAQTGVNACNIGAPGGAASEIYLGIDFGVDARLAAMRDQTVALTEKLKQVRLALRHGARERESLEGLEKRLATAIAALTEEAGEMVSELDRNDEAKLVVRGTVYEGTYIEICHRSYLVERTTGRCLFRIDKTRGVVTMEPLSAGRERTSHG